MARRRTTSPPSSPPLHVMPSHYLCTPCRCQNAAAGVGAAARITQPAMPLSNGCTYPAPKGTSGPPKELASYVAVTESVLNHCSSSCRRRCSCRWCRLHRDTHTPAIGAEAHDGTRHCEIIARPPPLALPLAPPLAPPLASSLSQSSQCGGVYTCAWTEFGALRIPRPPRCGHMGATVIPVR